MGGHYAGALTYADEITLMSPSMTGLRKMSSICEQYASEYDILFNGSKSKLLFFKGRCCNVSTLSIVVCGQLVEMSDTSVHLGHTITSNDRDNITKSAKSSFWKSFNILIAEFGKLSLFLLVNCLISIVVVFTDPLCGPSVVLLFRRCVLTGEKY